MKKSEEMRYRMGLTDCELRGKSNVRNAVRRKRKGEGNLLPVRASAASA